MTYLRKFACLTFAGLLLFTAQSEGAELDSLSVKAVKNQAEVTTIHVFYFKFTDVVSANSVFKIIYPQEFDLSALKAAGSNSINGGFLLRVDGQTVTVSRSGVGSELQPVKTYELAMANIKNAPSGIYPITVQLFNENGEAQGNRQTYMLTITQ